MSLTLHVDGPRWRAALRAAVAASPGMVPVVKGNGYGFGPELLFGTSAKLGADLVAIGTYTEVPEALACFPRDVLVMEPYRHAIHAGLPDLANRRLVHTITDETDLDGLRGEHPDARVVVEGLTSMNRFGAPRALVGALVAKSGAVGATLHLPLGTGHVPEIHTFLDAAPDVRTWFVSHTGPADLEQLRRRFPDRTFRPRVGTDLWLADRGCYEVRAHVLDVRPLEKHQRVGYRQRPQPGGHLLVVSGGTSHGVAMESPSAAATPRARAVALAEGFLEAAHRVRSPFTVSGVSPRFAEPPHMQCSLLVLPPDATPPAVGDTVEVRLRLTTAHPDHVEIS